MLKRGYYQDSTRGYEKRKTARNWERRINLQCLNIIIPTPPFSCPTENSPPSTRLRLLLTFLLVILLFSHLLVTCFFCDFPPAVVMRTPRLSVVRRNSLLSLAVALRNLHLSFVGLRSQRLSIASR